MKRMQMWLTTRSTSDPVLEVGNECYLVTPLGGGRYLVTRRRDSTRVGVFALSGSGLQAEESNPETKRLVADVAEKAKRRKLIR